MKPNTHIALRFRQAQPGERKVVVEARDVKDGVLLFTDGIAGTAEWLDCMGYRYVTGSSAIWTREQPAAVAAE